MPDKDQRCEAEANGFMLTYTVLIIATVVFVCIGYVLYHIMIAG